MDEIIYQIALSRIPNVGNITAKILLGYFGSAKRIFDADKGALLKITGIGEIMASSIAKANAHNLAGKEVDKFHKLKEVKAVFWSDEGYPKRLKHYDNAPLLLYVDGNADLNAHRTVAIVGTRNATEYGKMQCERLVEGLRNYGVQIISGLAYGIDGCAHRKATELNIPNIAVLGSGIDRIYPATHTSLANKIKQNGSIISQFSFGMKPDRENFPQRNYVVAGMSDVVVVVQSQKSGGSMITAEIANSLSKDVFAIPGRVNDLNSEGCNKLIKIHKAHLLESAKDIAYIMRWDPQEKVEAQMKLFQELNDGEQGIMIALREKESVDIDTLHALLNRPLSALSSDLLTLEFKGLVRSMPGKRYMAV